MFKRKQVKATGKKVSKSLKVRKITQIKTNIKSGGLGLNHNETHISDQAKTNGLKVRSLVRAGAMTYNHNETLISDQAKAKGLKVKSNVKAGGGGLPND